MAEIFYSSWKSQSSEQGYNYQWRLGFQYTITQNQSANTSTFKREIYLYYSSSNTSNYTPFPSTFTVNGGRTNYFTTPIRFSGTSNAKIYSDEVSVSHNNDGTYGNITLSVSYAGNSYQSYNSASKSVAVPSINRLATMLTAQNFTDEENPTITFNNPSNYTAKPYINFYDNNGIIVYQLYRDISATSPFTWDITNEERTALRNATNQQSTYNAYIGVDTYDGSTKLGNNSMKKTFTIVNAEPTATYTTTEQNANVISLLDSTSSSKVVNQVSSLLFEITPTALKGATITNVKINGVNATESSGTYSLIVNNITNGTFDVVITDSRTLQTTYTITKTLLDYVSLNINNWSIARASSVSSDLILNADITCYSSTIDGNTNTPTVQYSIGGTNWNTISSSSYSFDNNKITITNLTLQNVIVYTSYGTFYLKITDLLTNANDNKQISKGVETFSYGENDVQINGDLFIADTDGNNAVNVMDKIDQKNNISTTEKVVGVYNDDPLYRIEYQALSSGTYNTIPITNVITSGTLDKIIKMEGYIIQPSSNNVTNLNYYYSSSDYSNTYYNANLSALIWRTGSSYGGGEAHIILEYTKV